MSYSIYLTPLSIVIKGKVIHRCESYIFWQGVKMLFIAMELAILTWKSMETDFVNCYATEPMKTKIKCGSGGNH